MKKHYEQLTLILGDKHLKGREEKERKMRGIIKIMNFITKGIYNNISGVSRICLSRGGSGLESASYKRKNKLIFFSEKTNVCF